MINHNFGPEDIKNSIQTLRQEIKKLETLSEAIDNRENKKAKTNKLYQVFLSFTEGKVSWEEYNEYYKEYIDKGE